MATKLTTAFQRANQLASSELNVLYSVAGIADKKSPPVKRKVAAKVVGNRKKRT